MPDAAARLFSGAGSMAELCRELDWGSTPLGPVESWSSTLRVAAQLVLASGIPATVLWGRELVQIYNDAYAELIQAKHPSALGRSNLESWPEVAHINAPIYRRVFDGETVTLKDALYPLERSGELEDVYLTVSYSPIRDSGGAVCAVLATMVETTADVTLRALQAEFRAQAERMVHQAGVAEQARLAAEAALDDAARANAAKSEFVATISHELRTPLNAILGYADLLVAGVPVALPEAALGHVERVVASARHLRGLIDEVLTFSRLEAGGDDVGWAPVAVDTLLNEVHALTLPLAEEKGLRLEVRAPSDVPAPVSDTGKLRQVLVNLTGNAIKFTDRGRVEVSAQREGADLEFHVRDTGRGIAPEDLAHVFEPFWRRDSGTSGGWGGTGLGLGVARRLAHSLGGEITVESTLGAGSVFTLTVPLVPDPEAIGEG
ncbi:MAG: ATP-binding protein [Longimicrobiales bacterium]